MSPHLATAPEELHQSWSRLSPAERLGQFRQMHTGERGDFFLELSARDQGNLLLRLPQEQRHIWIRLLAPDDAADLVQEMNRKHREELLALMDDHTRKEVSALLAFKEDEAGGLMNPRFARLRPELRVDEAISYLRREAAQVENIYYAYVLDQQQHLLGVISLRQLFVANPEKLIKEVMNTSLVTVSIGTDQKEVASVVRESRLLSIPVLDADGRMAGIVTVDDVVDVVEEEASREIQKVGGAEALEAPYFENTFFQMVKKRAGWLAILFVGELFTATALGFFEDELAKAVVLALFLPLIISSGGNSGSQATTLVIQAMATSDIRLRDWYRVIWREFLAGLALGGILGIIGLTRIFAWQALFHTYGGQVVVLAMTILISLVGVVCFGSVAGSMLPFILRRCGLNPASASAPFVATLVDMTGLVIYFSVAKVVMLSPH